MKSNLTFAAAAVFTALSVVMVNATAQASPGLTVYAEEVGVGKFHRYDNQVHPYGAASAWLPYVLPKQAATDQTTTVENPDGSVSIFFLTLDDLLASVARMASQRHEPVSVLNIHGHGLPGGMWFPANASFQQSMECSSWNQAASGSDSDNYAQYYEPVDADEVQGIREMSQTANYHGTCTTGVAEWQAEVAKTPQFRSSLAPDAQVHFLSCVVGLGEAGRVFTEGVARLLFPDGHGAVETSVNFGLGDWSMPQGMGFWDMRDDAQMKNDGDIYSKDRKDSEIAQSGTIRLVVGGLSGWHSAMLTDQSFMTLGFEPGLPPISPAPTGSPGNESFVPEKLRSPDAEAPVPPPWRVRVPGTRAYVYPR